jgi:formate dehydrogenase maturation protein FdhE
MTPDKRGNLMPESQPVTQMRQPIARRPCPRCGWDLSVTSMVPGKRDRGERIFECSMCEHFEVASGKIK